MTKHDLLMTQKVYQHQKSICYQGRHDCCQPSLQSGDCSAMICTPAATLVHADVAQGMYANVQAFVAVQLGLLCDHALWLQAQACRARPCHALHAHKTVSVKHHQATKLKQEEHCSLTKDNPRCGRPLSELLAPVYWKTHVSPTA